MSMRGISTAFIGIAAALTATGNGAAVDVSQYEGLALIVLQSGGTNAGTLTTKLQHSDDGSTGWVDTGDTFTAVGTTGNTQELLVSADKFKKFVRAVDTLAGGANAVTRAVVMVGQKKYA